MSNGFREIRDTSPLSMKELNDQMRHLWTKVMGNLDSRDIKLGSLEEKNLSTEIVTKLGEISLMVTKDNVINSINLSTEGIAIDGTKVTINASNLDLSANQSIRLAVGQVGGVNLLPSSRYIMMYQNNAGLGTAVLYDDGISPYYYITASAEQISVYESDLFNYMNSNFVIGREYTVSVDVYPHIVCDVGIINAGVTHVLPVGQWSRISYTFNYTSGLRFSLIANAPTLSYRNWKLEQGKIPTAWTPSRADNITEINMSPGEITIQAGKIGILGETNIPNLKADKIVGGTLTMGGLDNGNGVVEVYNASGGLAARLNNAGLYAIAGTIGNFTITSSALTGGLIQTATSGGIKLNGTDGLRVFDNQSTPKVRIQVLPNQANPTLVFYDSTGISQHFTASYRPAIDGQMAGFWLSATSSHDLILFGRDVYAKSLIISSDINKKENIVPCSLEGIADKLMNLQTYEYNLKEDDPNNKTIGIMAQESPQEILNMANNAVDIYAYPTLLLQGIQDLYNRVVALESNAV